MPTYGASFANVYAFAKATLPTLEGVVASLKCYTICKSDSNYDVYTGFTTDGISALFDTLTGVGEKIGTAAAGHEMDVGDYFSTWADDPTEANPQTSAGYLTDHQYGILYITKPNLTGLVGANAPHDLTTINAIRKAMRNAAKLIGDVSASFPDFTTADRCWVASDIAAMQQWIIDKCGAFAQPSRIADASDLTKEQANLDLTGSGDLSIGQHAAAASSPAWYHFWSTFLQKPTNWGWTYADSVDENGPVTQRPGDFADPASGDRTCAAGDYVLTLQLMEIAEALEYLHGAPVSIDWTSNGQTNAVEGSSDELGTFQSYAEAKTDAEEVNSTGDSMEDAAPSQNSTGGYTPDDPITSSSSSSSSVGGVYSSSSSSSVGGVYSSSSISSYFYE